MEVKMNKEIRDYQESMFMGLDLRQCVFSFPTRRSFDLFCSCDSYSNRNLLWNA